MRHPSAVSSVSASGGISAESTTELGTVRVRGLLVDEQTRCAHYRSELDVIALLFHCCEEWFPCHLCHQVIADHPARPWPTTARTTEAVVCGVCRSRLRIEDYLRVDACPTCDAEFNPGCRLHRSLYFD